jgi:hypothetical protein
MPMTLEQQVELAQRLTARNYSSIPLEERGRIYAEELANMGIAVPPAGRRAIRLTTEQQAELEHAARQAVGHLVDAVGGKVNKDTFDYVGLCEALDDASAMAVMQRVGAGNGRRARAEKLAEVKEAAELLQRALFGSEDEASYWVRANIPFIEKGRGGYRYPAALPGQLEPLLEQLILRCGDLTGVNNRLLFDHDESAKWLVGIELPAIYKRFFGERAGISRQPDPPYRISGPYVRFGMAAMAYLDQACTISSFETYWKETRKFRPLPNGDSKVSKNS